MENEELNEVVDEEPAGNQEEPSGNETGEETDPVDPAVAEMIAMVKALSDETDDSVVSAFLTFVGKALYRYGDPYHTMTEDAFLALYPDVVVDAAAYKLNKRGWDYEKRHVENGITREFETGDLPASILNRITPICGVVK